MIAIFLWTLRQRKWFTIWWCIGVVALIAMLMAVYPSIHQQADELQKTISQLPAAIRALKTSSADDAFSPIGYLNSQLYYATLPLLFSILTINLGSGLLAKDEQAHTLELLLARPVSRTRVILGKALAGVAIVVIVALTTLVTTLALAKVVDLDIAASKVAVATLYATLLPLSFGVIAFTFTAMGRFAKLASIGVSTLFAFGGYLLSSLAGLSDWIEKPAQLLPYHYYNPYNILHGTVSGTLTAYLLAIFAIGACVSWISFRRRDIE